MERSDKPILVLREVTKSFPGDPPVRVLDRVSLSLGRGEAVAIIGPSGSGKSTILHLAGALDLPDSGDVAIDGQPTTRMTAGALARLRNERIGFVFQNHHLLPHCTALENVLIPCLARARTVSADAVERGRFLLRRVGLEARAGHLPGTLSGGERQRCAVVRALINRPGLILADEPTGALDRRNAEGIGELLAELNREEGAAMVVVTHSLDLAGLMQRRLELRDGQLHPVSP